MAEKGGAQFFHAMCFGEALTPVAARHRPNILYKFLLWFTFTLSSHLGKTYDHRSRGERFVTDHATYTLAGPKQDPVSVE